MVGESSGSATSPGAARRGSADLVKAFGGTADLDFEAQKKFRKGTQASEVIDYFAANFTSKGSVS